MKLILIGFMGAGKSLVAEMLAERLGFDHLEMDAHILEVAQVSSIKQLFAEKGESVFRRFEIEVADQLKEVQDTVISTGGGVVMNGVIFDSLRSHEHDRVIYLDTSFSSIQHRLRGDTSRPLFADIKKAKALYDLREPLYRYYADFSVTTDHKLPDTIVEEILTFLKLAQ